MPAGVEESMAIGPVWGKEVLTPVVNYRPAGTSEQRNDLETGNSTVLDSTLRDQLVDLRQVPVFLGIIEAVADDEDVLDFRAQVGHIDLYFSPGGLG